MKRLVLVALLCLVGCSDSGRTIKTLEAAGFTNVRPGGYSMWGCGDDDDLSTSFVATNPQGKDVEGVVCCGQFGKGCTIRF